IENKKNEIIESNESIKILVESQNRIKLEIDSYTKLLEAKRALTQKVQKVNEIERKLVSKINTIEKRNNFYHDNDTCPTCTQSIDGEFKKKIIDENTSSIEELRRAVCSTESNKKQLENSLLEFDNLEEQIKKCNNDLLDYNGRIYSLRKFVSTLEKQISQLCVANCSIGGESL
ncbi:hypothetical protein RZS08_41000, partial [Arthrospira platensis SPKY1]|nr:hypothetical protein [Arthrospira platensis SPKY1]